MGLGSVDGIKSDENDVTLTHRNIDNGCLAGNLLFPQQESAFQYMLVGIFSHGPGFHFEIGDDLEGRAAGVEMLDGRRTLRLVRKLKDGGRRVWNVDSRIWLPVRVATYDKKGRLRERYWYRKLKPNVALDDKAFDPEEIW